MMGDVLAHFPRDFVALLGQDCARGINRRLKRVISRALVLDSHACRLHGVLLVLEHFVDAFMQRLTKTLPLVAVFAPVLLLRRR